MLSSANRKSLELDRKGADAAQEKIRLESLLASAQNNAPASKRRSSRLNSVSNADDTVSVEAFQSIKGQLVEERRLRVKAETDLTATRAFRAESTFGGTLKDELSQVVTNDFTGPEIEPDLGHADDEDFDQELASALEAVRAANSKQAESDSDKRVLDQHIGSLADKIAGSRSRLMKQSEVNMFLRFSASTVSIASGGESSRASRLSVASPSLFSSKCHSPAPGASRNAPVGAPSACQTSRVMGSGSLGGYSTDPKLAVHPPLFITSPSKGKDKM